MPERDQSQMLSDLLDNAPEDTDRAYLQNRDQAQITRDLLDEPPANNAATNQRIEGFLRAHARGQTPWEQAAAHFQQNFPGYNPAPLRENYTQFGHDAQLEKVRELYAGADESTAMRVGTRAIPGASLGFGLAAGYDYGRAKKAFAEGRHSERDLHVIAAYDRRREIEQEQNQTYAGALTNAALHLPAMAGEFAAGGAIAEGILGAGARGLRAAGVLAPAAEVAAPRLLTTAGLRYAAQVQGPGAATRYIGSHLAREVPEAAARLAVTTATVPTLYAESWQQNNIAKGREAFDPRGLPAAYALGTLQMAVLGSLQHYGAGSFPGAGAANFLGRQGIRGAAGVAEQAAADVIAGSLGLQTHYGVIEDLLKQNHNDAFRNATVQAFTFAAFGGLHEAQSGTPAQQRQGERQRVGAYANEMMDAYLSRVNELARQPGMTQAKAGEIIGKEFDAVLEVIRRNPNATHQEAVDAFNNPTPLQQVAAAALPTTPAPTPSEATPRKASGGIGSELVAPPGDSRVPSFRTREQADRFAEEHADDPAWVRQGGPEGLSFRYVAEAPGIGPENPADASARPPSPAGTPVPEVAKTKPSQAPLETRSSVEAPKAAVTDAEFTEIKPGAPGKAILDQTRPLLLTHLKEPEIAPEKIGGKGKSLKKKAKDAPALEVPDLSAEVLEKLKEGPKTVEQLREVFTPEEAKTAGLVEQVVRTLGEKGLLQNVRGGMVGLKEGSPLREKQVEAPTSPPSEAAKTPAERMSEVKNKYDALLAEAKTPHERSRITKAAQAETDAILNEGQEKKTGFLNPYLEEGINKSSLSDVEKKVLLARLREGENNSLRAVAAELGISHQTVSNAEARALEKLPPELQREVAALREREVKGQVQGEVFSEAMRGEIRDMSADPVIDELIAREAAHEIGEAERGNESPAAIAEALRQGKADGLAAGAAEIVAEIQTSGRPGEQTVSAGSQSGEATAADLAGRRQAKPGGAGEKSGLAKKLFEKLQRLREGDDGTWLFPGNRQALKEGLEKARERIAKGYQFARDSYRELGGAIFPELTRLSRLAGEALARFTAAPGWVSRAVPYFTKQILGENFGKGYLFTEAQRLTRGGFLQGKQYFNKVETAVRMIAGGVISEMRLLYMKGYYRQENIYQSNVAAAKRQAAAEASNPAIRDRLLGEAAAAAKLATEAMIDAREVKSIVGMAGSPFATRAEYLRAKNSPEMQGIISRWRAEFAPIMDEMFQQARGFNNPVQVRTQIPGLPVNLLRADPSVPSATTVGAVRGNLGNVTIKRDPFARQAKGTAEAYDIDIGKMIENTLQRRAGPAREAEFFRTAVAEGIGQFGAPGQRAEGYREWPNARPAAKTQVTDNISQKDVTARDTSFYIKEEGYNDLRKALAPDQPARLKMLDWLKNFTLQGAFFSTIEVLAHTKNNLTLLFQPGVGIPSILRSTYGVLSENPVYQKRLLDLASISAAKDPGAKAKWYEPGKRFLEPLGDIMRLVAEDAFVALTKRPQGWGRVENTETNKRDFINQLGNYNPRSMSGLVAFLRDSGIGSFAVAAFNYNVQGVRTLTANPGVRAETYRDQALLRAEKLGKIVGVAVTSLLANYLLWGKVTGDDKTPFLEVKTGEKDGKTSSISLMNFTGLNRGMHQFGLTGLIEGLLHGDSQQRIVSRSLSEIGHSAAHPFIGPMPQFAQTALHGTDFWGRQLAQRAVQGEQQEFLNLKAALLNWNNPIAVATGADRPREELTSDRFWRLGRPFVAGEHGVPYRSRQEQRFQSLSPQQQQVETLRLQLQRDRQQHLRSQRRK